MVFRATGLAILTLGIACSEAMEQPLASDSFAYTLSRADIEARLNDYLVKSPSLYSQIQLTDTSLTVSSPDGLTQQSLELALPGAERVLPASPLDVYRAQPAGQAPLSGLRVAIDPGHFGGPLARIERRYIDMGPSELTQNVHIQFDEGTLTLQTAFALRERLIAAGAQVFLTREEVGVGALDTSFADWHRQDLPRAVDEWLAKHPELPDPESERQRWLTQASKSQIFREFYNPLDLAARAAAINEYHPHVTLFLHYNVGAGNDAATGQNLPSEFDYGMAFVGGSFAAGELTSSEDISDFLRLLVTQDVPRSVALADEIVAQWSQEMAIPAVGADTPVPTDYLNKYALRVHDGVYCRNLALTRTVHGVLAYGEPLCQDHPDEALALSTHDAMIAGQPASSRVVETADAYFGAVLKQFRH